MFSIVKLIHIISSIIALGLNCSYFIWQLKAKKDPKHLLFTLKQLKFLDDKVANPAYIIVLFSGLLMSYISGYNILEKTWLWLPLLLFSLMALLGLFVYTPTLLKQIETLEKHGEDVVFYRIAETKQTVIGIVLIAIAFCILGIMVFKPN